MSINSWSVGNWESCSRTCGGGITHRTVQCTVLQHGSHTPVAESHCRGQRKPQTSKSCNITPCPGVWKATDWSCVSLPNMIMENFRDDKMHDFLGQTFL